MIEHMFVREEGLITPAEMNLRLLALCSIEGVNWNVVAREALRSGGLARLLAGEVGETSRDGEATRTRITQELATIEERVEQMRVVVADAQDKVGARLVTVLDRAEYPSNLRVIPSPPPFLFCRGDLRRDDARSVAVVGTRQASEEGLSRARRLAEKLTADGVTVISGRAGSTPRPTPRRSTRAGARSPSSGRASCAPTRRRTPSWPTASPSTARSSRSSGPTLRRRATASRCATPSCPGSARAAR